MNQKGVSSIVIILIIVGILVVAGGVWYWQSQKEKPVVCTQDTKLCPDGSYVSRTGPNCEFAACPEVKDVNWEALISKVTEVVKKEFNGAGSVYPIKISKTADVTGDGISEALVDLGMPGATTDLLTVLRIEEGQPIVAKFKAKDGKISVMEFTSGSGGSGRYSSFVNLMPEEYAISSGSYMAYGEPNDSCSSDIFKWNSNTKLFEYDSGLSQESSTKRCKELCETWPMDKSLLKYICK